MREKVNPFINILHHAFYMLEEIKNGLFYSVMHDEIIRQQEKIGYLDIFIYIWVVNFSNMFTA